jgi:hypothetical protein
VRSSEAGDNPGAVGREGGAIHKVDEDKLAIKKDGQATLVSEPYDSPKGDRFGGIAARSKRRPISIEGVSIIMDTPRYFFNILRLHDASFLGS